MKKKVAVVLAIVLCINLFFCSCGSYAPTPPQYIKTLGSTLDVEGAALKTVNVYFDNTQSMYGFVCDGQGYSNFVASFEKLSDIVRGYTNFSFNVLKPDSQNYLQWTKLNEYEVKDFKNKSFYTYKGCFTDSSLGPLQTLFGDQSVVDFDNLNIFITDMAEQNLANKDLADRINEIVLSRPDYSVMLFCVKSMFNGFASVPVFGYVENGKTKTLDTKSDNPYNGERPFYCIAIGQTDEILNLSEMYSNSLIEAGLEENTDFFKTEIIASRGLQYTSPYDVETEIFEKSDIYDYMSVTSENTNVNFNVDLCASDMIFEGVNDKLPGICCEVNSDDSTDKSTENKAQLSLLFPLSSLSNGQPATGTSYSLETEDLGSKSINICDVYGWDSKQVTTQNEDGEDEDVTEWNWEKLDSYDYFKSSDPFITIDGFVADKGAQLTSVNDYGSNEEHNEAEFPSSLVPVTTIENESGALYINIKLNNIDKIECDYISLDIKVFGSRKQDNNSIPDWIREYDLDDADKPNFDNPLLSKEYFEKTQGLLDFYKYLINFRSSAQESDRYESNMTRQISEIPVTIKIR